MAGGNAVGIAVSTDANSSAVITGQNLAITNNNVSQMTGSNAVGISEHTIAFSYGVVVSQSVVIESNTVSAIAGRAGILAVNYAVIRGFIGQSLFVGGNTVTGIS